jgi:hypothetical protein
MANARPDPARAAIARLALTEIRLATWCAHNIEQLQALAHSHASLRTAKTGLELERASINLTAAARELVPDVTVLEHLLADKLEAESAVLEVSTFGIVGTHGPGAAPTPADPWAEIMERFPMPAAFCQVFYRTSLAFRHHPIGETELAQCFDLTMGRPVRRVL